MAHLCNKNSLISFVKQQPPTTSGLPQQLEPQHLGQSAAAHKIDDDEYGGGRLPSPTTLCMISPTVEICNNQIIRLRLLETWSYHQVET
jgi:hypothetical protein